LPFWPCPGGAVRQLRCVYGWPWCFAPCLVGDGFGRPALGRPTTSSISGWARWHGPCSRLSGHNCRCVLPSQGLTTGDAHVILYLITPGYRVAGLNERCEIHYVGTYIAISQRSCLARAGSQRRRGDHCPAWQHRVGDDRMPMTSWSPGLHACSDRAKQDFSGIDYHARGMPAVVAWAMLPCDLFRRCQDH
jgi:hypothetical protein